MRFSELGIDVNDVVNRMRATLGVSTDAELADALRIAAEAEGLPGRWRPNRVSMWRKNDSIPTDALLVWSSACRRAGVRGTIDDVFALAPANGA